ncbi:MULTISPECIES: thioesterase domain-containing protein [unclassified Nocardia]|uniref:thioesterase domain-containing protein n=1 Tax=unclassified Nocardia TaxID=2637762 RepID=UPI001CE4ACE6|nr:MULTISPECIES: thioesterase domain-containing protein [unclassified Nocardia]
MKESVRQPFPLELWQPGTGRDVLCLIHPIGGDVRVYRALAAALDPALTVCLIADPALRQDVSPQWTLAERAANYHSALLTRFPNDEWRWQLAGWSFGAWVAIGMAAESEAAGAPVRALHLIDPPPPASGVLFRHYDEAKLAAIIAHELDSAEGPGTQQYAEQLARCCRTNLRSMSYHRLPRLTQTPSRLWVADRPVPELTPTATPQVWQATWHAHLPEPSAWQCLDTDHYGIMRSPHAEVIAAGINSTIGELNP